jgi:hypothetical protein
MGWRKIRIMNTQGGRSKLTITFWGIIEEEKCTRRTRENLGWNKHETHHEESEDRKLARNGTVGSQLESCNKPIFGAITDGDGDWQKLFPWCTSHYTKCFLSRIHIPFFPLTFSSIGREYSALVLKFIHNLESDLSPCFSFPQSNTTTWAS